VLNEEDCRRNSNSGPLDVLLTLCLAIVIVNRSLLPPLLAATAVLVVTRAVNYFRQISPREATGKRLLIIVTLIWVVFVVLTFLPPISDRGGPDVRDADVGTTEAPQSLSSLRDMRLLANAFEEYMDDQQGNTSSKELTDDELQMALTPYLTRSQLNRVTIDPLIRSPLQFAQIEKALGPDATPLIYDSYHGMPIYNKERNGRLGLNLVFADGHLEFRYPWWTFGVTNPPMMLESFPATLAFELHALLKPNRSEIELTVIRVLKVDISATVPKKNLASSLIGVDDVIAALGLFRFDPSLQSVERVSGNDELYATLVDIETTAYRRPSPYDVRRIRLPIPSGYFRLERADGTRWYLSLGRVPDAATVIADGQPALLLVDPETGRPTLQKQLSLFSNAKRGDLRSLDIELYGSWLSNVAVAHLRQVNGSQWWLLLAAAVAAGIVSMIKKSLGGALAILRDRLVGHPKSTAQSKPETDSDEEGEE